MGKFFLTKKQIEDDIKRGQELVEKGIIKENVIPDYWCKDSNPNLSKQKVIYYSIFLGFFGIDRFYLGKKISGVTKLMFLCVINILVGLWIYYFVSYKNANMNNEALKDTITQMTILISIFPPIFITIGLSYYFVDIYHAIKGPRDKNFKCVL
ncbi:NINE protein [Mycoplasma sp. NEAQ87857]|uniref:TM2 domain-containing protein n=1 Tax=Mycoplasma sp. NEAQ87857 TaxID=2683967 RepID=UPI001316A112|nr:TM2 domain-containing protein [Mycoplasma sp. NEAQ87857]QGZ97907.1 NINE protein [Mycoplasma sp. NEAQ87857]